MLAQSPPDDIFAYGLPKEQPLTEAFDESRPTDDIHRTTTCAHLIKSFLLIASHQQQPTSVQQHETSFEIEVEIPQVQFTRFTSDRHQCK